MLEKADSSSQPLAGAPIKSFDGQVVVVKFGGNAMGDEAVFESLIDDTVTLIKKGVRVIVVHGGGTAVNDALAAIGKTTEKVNGLRVTDAETLDIAVKTFTGINERLVQRLQEKGAQPLSFCAKSANPIICEKMSMQDKNGTPVDLGWVGQITDVNSSMLESWLWAGWTPVISPMAMDADGHYYNINADHAALAVATELQADGLFFLTDVPGVLKDVSDPASRISHLTVGDVQGYIDEGTITGGMLPKIKSCVAGIKGGVGQIAIMNSFEPHALVNGFIAPQEIGTLITAEATAS